MDFGQDDAGALVLLLGVGYDKCTCFAAHPPRRGCRTVGNDGRGPGWYEFEDVRVDDSDLARPPSRVSGA
ncbi:hypothetical protein ACIBQ1_07355 [Nonomuraea sp. NPDC050153]|uniref:hypothetical protein n=1 Tax=Nonomuraea sp. NPDC050153 TaxID=3364359 RepID=UPI0037A126C6